MQPETDFPLLRLRHNEDRRISKGHLWVFSNEIDTTATPLKNLTAGTICRIVSSRDKFLGFGYVNPNALICARLLTRDTQFVSLQSLITQRLQRAYALRERLYTQPFYRLVYGETDGLPGLVLDRYGDIVVGQIGTVGMEAMKEDIARAITQVIQPRTLVWKNDSSTRALEGLDGYFEVAFGTLPNVLTLNENNVDFFIDIQHGQKTGWFFDQANNRQALLKYVANTDVLDVCSYVGAWGLAAAKAGARSVTCVDSSATALSKLSDTATANGLQVTLLRDDAFDALTALHAAQRKFGVVIIDPPAFIKRKKDLPKGEAAYRRLNQLAMQLLDQDGILVSCSCSYHLGTDALVAAIQHAARHLNRCAQIIEVRGQAPDHPIHPAIEETRYLKTLFVRVTA